MASDEQNSRDDEDEDIVPLLEGPEDEPTEPVVVPELSRQTQGCTDF